MTVTHTRQQARTIGLGYEGLSIDEFVLVLRDQRIEFVADVRLTPISRKRGFSKRALSGALGGAGIEYLHLPALGNPKDNRAGFSGSEADRATAKSTFRHRLDSPEARNALAQLQIITQTHRTAVICFESDQQCCHRDIILSTLLAKCHSFTASDSTHQGH